MVAAPSPPSPATVRTDGCGLTCRTAAVILPGQLGRLPVVLHDPAHHEAHGRETVLGPPALVTRTGPLTIDHRERCVSLAGVGVALTPTEWRILAYLDRMRSRTCSQSEILGAVWGSAYTLDSHLLRVNVTRLRAALWPVGWLIHTRTGYGYSLLDQPISDVLPPPALPLRPRVPQPVGANGWALRYERCVCCGRAERKHAGHGRCDYCRIRRGRYNRPHVGPCGAPQLAQERDQL